MTEEEKALAGYLYLAKEKELQKERERSQELSYEYNQLLGCFVAGNCHWHQPGFFCLMMCNTVNVFVSSIQH